MANIGALSSGIQNVGDESLKKKTDVSSPKSEGKDFASYLQEKLGEINEQQKTADKMTASVAMGKSDNVHETMLAVSQAEISFKLMVQVRNKALEAYQEVMRMPV